MSHFDKVRDYLMELEYSIINEDKEGEVFMVESEEDGISNLVIGLADPTDQSGPSTSILNSGCRSSCVEYEVGTQNLYLHLPLSISSCVRKLLMKLIYL